VTSKESAAKAAIAKEYFAAVNRRDFDAVRNILSPDFVFEHEFPVEGRDTVVGMLQGFCTSFPDLEISVTDVINAEGDEAVVFMVGSGTWLGEFAGVPPTGKQFTASTVDRMRFSGDSIASISTVCEVLGGFSLMHKLGIPAQSTGV